MQEDFILRLKSGWRHALCVLIGFTAAYILYFSPVLFSGKILANGDNLLLYAPMYFMRHTYWSELLTCGYPLFADPQVQHWYPLAWIFHGLIRDWNCYIVVVYILSSCFAYGLVFALTGSRTAALIGGIIYGMNGWIMSNLEHSGIIHCDIWLPLVLWSYVELRKNFRPLWFVLAALSLACLVLAGQTGVVAFLMMSVAYWIICEPFLAQKDRLKLFGALSLSCLLGLGISMIAMLPALEYSSTGFMRLHMKVEDLVGYYNPLQIFNFVFPYLFGGVQESPYGVNYFGPRDMQTVSCYIGLSVLTLVALGCFATWKCLRTKLWFAYTLLMLLLSLGDTTPFGIIVHYLPIYNHIRVPPRHFNDFSLGMAVLAAFGVVSLLARTSSGKILTRACFVVVTFVSTMVYPSILVLNMVQGKIKGAVNMPFFQNPALLVPLFITIIQLPIFYLLFKKPEDRMRRVALIALIVCDLGSFSWFLPWHYAAAKPADFQPPSHAARYRNLLLPLHQRILPVRGTRGSADELYPNLSAVWEIPSSSCYMNFMAQRHFQFFTMPDGGFIMEDWASPENRVLDIAAVRYVFCPKNDPRFPLPADAQRWKKVEEIGSAIVYENRRAAPRAWLVDEVKTLPKEVILKACRTSELDGVKSFDPLKTALVEEPCTLESPGADADARVQIINLSSESVEIQTQSSTGKFLILSDTYYPGWNADIDGKPAKVLITDFDFRGIAVPPGSHKVTFRFQPLSLKIGAGICLASLLALLGLYCFFRAKKE